jgi:ligand-binding SRPBCC domain-containing protein
MKINVQTFIKTSGSVGDVFKLFNQDMFYFLTKNAPVKPIRYDGDYVGSEIHLELTFPWKQEWISVITERSEGVEKSYFIDVGSRLPFNIKEWKHAHIVRKVDNGVVIEDAIDFRSSNMFYEFIWWMSFLPQFLIRKGQYRGSSGGRVV